MSNPMDWMIQCHSKPGEPLTSKYIEALVEFDRDDLEDVEWDENQFYLTCFSTESFGALTRIRHAVEEWAAVFPDAELYVWYRFENAWNPDGFIAAGGKVRETTGHVKFTYDDTGEEVGDW